MIHLCLTISETVSVTVSITISCKYYSIDRLCINCRFDSRKYTISCGFCRFDSHFVCLAAILTVLVWCGTYLWLWCKCAVFIDLDVNRKNPRGTARELLYVLVIWAREFLGDGNYEKRKDGGVVG